MITEATIPTFTAQIYGGLKNQETRRYNYFYEDVVTYCQRFCDEIGWCVTVNREFFIYKDGAEVGFRIGAIQYPRFPYEIEEIKRRTLKLAHELIVRFDQCRMTVVFPDETIMLSNEEMIEKVENARKST